VTVVAQQPITLSFTDQGVGVFSVDTFTLKKNSSLADDISRTITVLGTWASTTWSVDGGVSKAAPVTVPAADYSVGGHFLTVTVVRSGVPWSKSLPFTVIAGVTGISLNKTTLELPVGGTETLTAAVLPANAANKALTWGSSNTAIATVTAGQVTAMTVVGSATITVTTSDGSFTDTCVVTVTSAQPITLSFTDQGSGVFSEGPFIVYKSGSPGNKLITLMGIWIGHEWFVDGASRGTGASITINANDYSLGGHSLTCVVENSGVPWSKTINFTVTN
jgi:hypothetical protein